MRKPMGVDFICRQTTWARSRCRCSEKAEMSVQPEGERANIAKKWKVDRACTSPGQYSSTVTLPTPLWLAPYCLGVYISRRVHVTMRSVLSRANTTYHHSNRMRKQVAGVGRRRLFLYQCLVGPLPPSQAFTSQAAAEDAQKDAVALTLAPSTGSGVGVHSAIASTARQH
jgi:hypothetical protein